MGGPIALPTAVEPAYSGGMAVVHRGDRTTGSRCTMAVPLSVGTYVHWGVVSISVTNLSIIVAMVVVFVLAILLPFPHHEESVRSDQVHQDRAGDRADEGRRS
jgi:hypothetical protein